MMTAWATGRCLDRLVVLVRDGAFPDSQERRGAQLDQGSVVGDFVGYRLAAAAEVVEHDAPVIEQPEVVARQGDIRSLPPGQPPYFLTGSDIQRRCNGVLEADVVADRLADDTGATDLDATGDDWP